MVPKGKVPGGYGGAGRVVRKTDELRRDAAADAFQGKALGPHLVVGVAWLARKGDGVTTPGHGQLAICFAVREEGLVEGERLAAVFWGNFQCSDGTWGVVWP